MPNDIFISYSRRNLKAVTPIKEELESLGFSCWMDLEGIESGSEEFTRHITDAINGSKAVLFFLSAASQASEWSLKELRFAKEKGKHTVVVRFNDAAMTDAFIFNFGGDDNIDWRDHNQKSKLLRDLARWTGKSLPDSEPEEEPRPSHRPRSAGKAEQRLPIRVEFTEAVVPGSYVMTVENVSDDPVDISICVRNGTRETSYDYSIDGGDSEDFRVLGGTWRFTDGDKGTIRVAGWRRRLKFEIDEDGYYAE